MVATADKFLGHGLYSVAEAAMYANASPQLISRWVFDRSDRQAPLRREIDSKEKIVSFLDFIQCLSVRQARNQQGVSLQKIRLAVDYLYDKHGIEYPFAQPHELFKFEDQVVYKHHKLGYLFVTGKEKEQSLMPIIQPHLKQLTFDLKTGLAKHYTIRKEDGIEIVMRAESRFGEPTMPSGYTAHTLWDAVRIEGGYEQGARACGVSVDEVRVAFQFYDSLLRGS